MRLTLTWDVLKQKEDIEFVKQMLINFNMGCIETLFSGISLNAIYKINFNMGCIETH